MSKAATIQLLAMLNPPNACTYQQSKADFGQLQNGVQPSNLHTHLITVRLRPPLFIVYGLMSKSLKNVREEISRIKRVCVLLVTSKQGSTGST